MKKNVLLITVDQWSGDYMECAGSTDVLTPTLDELAGYGLRFTNAVSSTPVCIPARRELMLGVSSKTHKDRCFDERLGMPGDIPSMAELFRRNGYQTFCAGKLHVFPQRDRIGFDDVALHEEGRHKEGLLMDDYERFLALNGHYGQEFAHCMCNNNYFYRPFHLPEDMHPTNWAVRQVCESILRKDPTRPAFWNLSFVGPHPPICPPQAYLDLYADREFAAPNVGDWATRDAMPYACRYYSGLYHIDSPERMRTAKRGYYATCTHIDHQLRLVLGTLREQGLLKNTVVLFTADHGDMLGEHNLFGKFLMYERSVKIPFILSAPSGCGIPFGATDDRLVELKDVLPTLLSLSGNEVPEHVEGIDLSDFSAARPFSYGELWEDDRATRMIRTRRYKLIYYAVGNRFQLFDLEHDRHEMRDLSNDPAHRDILDQLVGELRNQLYGNDREWLTDGRLTGLPMKDYDFEASLNQESKLFQERDFLLQRGIR